MKINSLNIEYNNQRLITDIDDCLIKSSKSIKSLGLDRRNFYLNPDIYSKYKEKVFYNAELTEWGKEFKNMIKSGKLTNYLLLTSAGERMYIIINIFDIEPKRLFEGITGSMKVNFLNSLQHNFIYIDDKPLVGITAENTFGTFITYPRREVKKLKYFKRKKKVL